VKRSEVWLPCRTSRLRVDGGNVQSLVGPQAGNRPGGDYQLRLFFRKLRTNLSGQRVDGRPQQGGNIALAPRNRGYPATTPRSSSRAQPSPNGVISHGTFEDYCRERWDLSKAHAYETMDASKVAAVLDAETSENLGQSIPSPRSSWTVRPLAKVLRETNEQQPPTAAQIPLNPLQSPDGKPSGRGPNLRCLQDFSRRAMSPPEREVAGSNPAGRAHERPANTGFFSSSVRTELAQRRTEDSHTGTVRIDVPADHAPKHRHRPGRGSACSRGEAGSRPSDEVTR
jgi:hypothetical protein